MLFMIIIRIMSLDSLTTQVRFVAWLRAGRFVYEMSAEDRSRRMVLRSAVPSFYGFYGGWIPTGWVVQCSNLFIRTHC